MRQFIVTDTDRLHIDAICEDMIKLAKETKDYVYCIFNNTMVQVSEYSTIEQAKNLWLYNINQFNKALTQNKRIGFKKEIDIDDGIVLNTPIGELEIQFLEKDCTGNENVVRIINNDKSIVIIPKSSNSILIKDLNI